MADKKLAAPFADVTSTFPVSAVFSPDGKWFAYTRNIALFVQPFRPTGPPFHVAAGLHPIWPAGTELFWGPAFEREYDAMPDGKRFLSVMDVRPPGTAPDETARRIDVVLNWFTELRQRAPTK